MKRLLLNMAFAYRSVANTGLRLKLSLALVTLFLMVLTGFGIWHHNQEIAKQKLEASQRIALESEHNMEGSKQALMSDSKSPSNGSGTAGSSNQTQTSSTVKYATSPDPRSTSYSTTPPAPNPASFSNPITHANQVAAGTLIAYNATKGVKTYYGGDLMCVNYDPNFNSVTIMETKGQIESSTFIASTPDGAIASMPEPPYDDTSTVAVAGTHGSGAPAASWQLELELVGSPAPNATTPYIVHLQSIRSGSGGSEWEYDCFIPLYVR